MNRDQSLILAQLAHEGRPLTPAAIADALGWRDDAGPAFVEGTAGPLLTAGLVRLVRAHGERRARYLEATERGRLEAAGGAQMTLAGAPERPRLQVQEVMF